MSGKKNFKFTISYFGKKLNMVFEKDPSGKRVGSVGVADESRKDYTDLINNDNFKNDRHMLSKTLKYISKYVGFEVELDDDIDDGYAGIISKSEAKNRYKAPKSQNHTDKIIDILYHKCDVASAYEDKIRKEYQKWNKKYGTSKDKQFIKSTVNDITYNFEYENIVYDVINDLYFKSKYTQEEFRSFVEKIKKDYKQWSKRNGFKKNNQFVDIEFKKLFKTIKEDYFPY